MSDLCNALASSLHEEIQAAAQATVKCLDVSRQIGRIEEELVIGERDRAIGRVNLLANFADGESRPEILVSAVTPTLDRWARIRSARLIETTIGAAASNGASILR